MYRQYRIFICKINAKRYSKLYQQSVHVIESKSGYITYVPAGIVVARDIILYTYHNGNKIPKYRAKYN